MQLSVLIPTCNRRETLQRVLTAYEEQIPDDLPFEVVVVDDGSRDHTAEMLAAWRSRRFVLRFASQPNSGPARARNRALELARGSLILITGDDIEPTPSLLAEHVRAHRSHADPDVAILGLTRWPPGAATTATMRHIDGPGAQQFSYGAFRDGAEYDFRHFYTSNISAPRRLLDREPSYFSTDFPSAAFEDAEYSYRLSRHGLRIVYHAAAVGFHHHPYTAARFFDRQVRCGEMAAILYEKFPQVRKHLELDFLESLHLAGLADRSVDGLDEAEARWKRLAGFFDPLPFAVDEVLQALFRYAYLKGLAYAVYGPRLGRRLAAAVFAEIVPGAAGRFLERARRERIPFPMADLEPFLDADRFVL